MGSIRLTPRRRPDERWRRDSKSTAGSCSGATGKSPLINSLQILYRPLIDRAANYLVSRPKLWNQGSGVKFGLVTEIILNFAWALCALGLILLWARAGISGGGSRRTQILALTMVVMLLLPVISLSDDLMAMQSPAETDTCLRRTLHPGEGHPSLIPHSMAMPAQFCQAPSIDGVSQEAVQTYRLAPPSTSLIRSLDSRPPPQV